MHREHGADREVRCDEDGDVGLAGKPRIHLVEARIGEPGGANDGVDSVVDQELQVVHHYVGVGEVDDDVSLAVDEQGERIADVDADREREVVGGLHRVDHGRPDLALGAQDSDSHVHTLAACG